MLSAVRRCARNAAHCVIVVMTAPYLRVVVPCGAVQKQPDHTRSRTKLCHRDTAPVAANRVAVRAENNGVHCCMNDSSEAARSEEHTSELQSLMRISYAVFCLKKKKKSKKQ